MIRFPPRKILVPLDGSEGAYTAWEQAQFFARIFRSRVQGLHVPVWALGTEPWAGEPMIQSFDMARDIAERVGKENVVTFAGTTAERVARTCPAPVLTLPMTLPAASAAGESLPARALREALRRAAPA